MTTPATKQKTAMTLPPRDFLLATAALRRGMPRALALATLRALRCTGQRWHANEDGARALLDSTRRETYLAWQGPDGEERGAFFLAADAKDRLCTASLNWILGTARPSAATGFETQARWLMDEVAEILGPPLGMLLDLSDGLSASGEQDLVVARAYWQTAPTPAGQVTATYRGAADYAAFHDAQDSTLDALTLWLVVDPVQDAGTLSAMFTAFRAD